MILNKQYFLAGLTSLLCVQALLASSNTSTLNRLALLICTFIKIGLDYKILDFYFLGLTYIIVYVGAISILFLFVIMITDTGKTPNSPLLTNKVSNIYGTALSVLFLLLLFSPFTFYFSEAVSLGLESNNSNIQEYYVPSYNSEFLTITDIESLGYILYLGYPIIIVLIGVLLWCVLIGILRISGL